MGYEITLDNSLEVKESDFPKYNYFKFFRVEDGLKQITEFDKKITHRNYLDYLGLCWNRHYGAVITPTIIWNMILNNLAFEVNKNPNTYRKYFTNAKDGKKDIVVYEDGNIITPKLLIDELEYEIPGNMFKYCFPEFTTDTEKSNVAMYSAFLDMVSPYYVYSMYMCGIPKVKVLGDFDDWSKIVESCMHIYKEIPEFKNYLSDAIEISLQIRNCAADFSKMFSLKRCGSGSQVEVSGWIKELFIEKPSIEYPNNFVSCISKVDYNCLNNKKR